MAGRDSIEVIRQLAVGEQRAAAADGRIPNLDRLNQVAFSLLPQESAIMCTAPVAYQRNITYVKEEKTHRKTLVKLPGGPIIGGRFAGITTGGVETEFAEGTNRQVIKLGFHVYESKDTSRSFIVPVDMAEVKDVRHALDDEDFIAEVDSLAGKSTTTMDDIVNFLIRSLGTKWKSPNKYLYDSYLKGRLYPVDYVSRVACRQWFYSYGEDQGVSRANVAQEEQGVGYLISALDSFGVIGTVEGDLEPIIEKIYDDRTVVLPLGHDALVGYDLPHSGYE